MPGVAATDGNNTFPLVVFIRTGLHCQLGVIGQWQSGEVQGQSTKGNRGVKNKEEQYKLTHIDQIR
jgi:hypothetical protein